MKNLWTPWRMEHVQGKALKVDHCIFEPPGTTSHSKEDLLLLRNEEVVVLLNRFPYANGHLLLAPANHIGSINDMTVNENMAVMAMLQDCTRILQKHLAPDGFNIGCNLGSVAGAGIEDHLHFHIVPRWQEDHNFMTVVADIRTIPEHIDQTFDKLLPDFRQL